MFIFPEANEGRPSRFLPPPSLRLSLPSSHHRPRSHPISKDHDMSIVPPRVRTLLHLLFALFALSLVRFITTRTPSESSEEEDLRRKALVLAITTLSGLVVVRAEDLFEHEGPVDEAFKEKMDLMERSLGFAGVFFWGGELLIVSSKK